jgi:2,3,4,5-tetrahydropyridine-2-carboxylate N-succinyltransferase
VTQQAAGKSALQQAVESLSAVPSSELLPASARGTVAELIAALESGTVRSAVRNADGKWSAEVWVKQGILVAFRVGTIVDMSPANDKAGPFSFVDKDTLPARRFTVAEGVRVVPGGSSIRRGAYLAKGVVCMPPIFVNVGAWIGAGTMVDSHALVGSCAQVGERVHLSAAAQIGGVLEPVNAAPVIIEDDVVVGGNCGVYEGTVVRSRAVLGAGVVLTRGTPVYDLVRETVYRGSAETPLEIPSGAVVVPGSRRIAEGWGAERGLALQTPVIVKYRDAKTDTSTALEGWLR